MGIDMCDNRCYDKFFDMFDYSSTDIESEVFICYRLIDGGEDKCMYCRECDGSEACMLFLNEERMRYVLANNTFTVDEIILLSDRVYSQDTHNFKIIFSN